MPPVVLSALKSLEGAVAQRAPSRDDVVSRIVRCGIACPPPRLDLGRPVRWPNERGTICGPVLRQYVLQDEVPALGVLGGCCSDMTLHGIGPVVVLVDCPGCSSAGSTHEGMLWRSRHHVLVGQAVTLYRYIFGVLT